MPFLFLLYLTSYLDRVNVSYASLEMTRHLHFSNLVFGIGFGDFLSGVSAAGNSRRCAGGTLERT